MIGIKPEVFFLCDTQKDTLKLNYELILQNNLIEKSKLVPVVTEEEIWCFKPESLDLIVSNLNLHWVNDLQVSFLRFLDSLMPDGAIVGLVN